MRKQGFVVSVVYPRLGKFEKAGKDRIRVLNTACGTWQSTATNRNSASNEKRKRRKQTSRARTEKRKEKKKQTKNQIYAHTDTDTHQLVPIRIIQRKLKVKRFPRAPRALHRSRPHQHPALSATLHDDRMRQIGLLALLVPSPFLPGPGRAYEVAPDVELAWIRV